MMGRRAFLTGSLGAALGACAPPPRHDGFWSVEPGRRPMRWGIKHSLQVTPEEAELKIHFRNVDQTLPNFRETFLNDGTMDMYKIIRKLAEVGFDGVLSADHVPSTTGPGRAGEAYTVGYIQALIERANEEVFY